MCDGAVHVVLVVEAEAAEEERPHVLLLHAQDGGGRLRSLHVSKPKAMESKNEHVNFDEETKGRLYIFQCFGSA